MTWQKKRTVNLSVKNISNMVSLVKRYEQRADRTENENDTKEADIVFTRIAILLGGAFQFSPAE